MMMLFPLLNIVHVILTIYWYLLIANALMSWVPDMAQTTFGRILLRLTDPYLGIFRRFVPPLRLGGGYLDLSYIVAIIAYYFIERGITAVLFGIIGLGH